MFSGLRSDAISKIKTMAVLNHKLYTIGADMQFSNFHQHTTFSDGKDTPEDVVLSAIDKGFDSIGFSDHSDTCTVDPTYCMKVTDYPSYFAEIKRLKEKYADRIKIYTGIELDYYSEIDRSEFDYVIGSVHYLCVHGVCHPIDHSKAQQETYITTECGGSIAKFAQDYYDQVVRNIEKNRPDIIGHFDVITKFGLIDETDPEYRHIALSALDRIMKITPVVEMNTGAISRHVRTVPYPAPFILERILENGGDVILGADSHAKDTIDCYFPECVEILKKIGFDHIVKFTENGFIKEII